MSKWEIQQPVTDQLVQLTFSGGERKLIKFATTSARAHPKRRNPLNEVSLYRKSEE